MEEQDILNKATGTKEVESLKPEIVNIVKTEIQEVGDKGNKKLVCSVKHPEKEELIHISSVKYEKNGKLQVSGLWANLDEDGNIRKGSALAELTSFLKCQTPKDLETKDALTTVDDKGYLCFKVY